MREPQNIQNRPKRFSEEIGRAEQLRLQTLRHVHKPVWLGFGVMGLVGWGIVVPSIAGLAFGAWLDSAHPGKHSWTLSFFSAGLLIGCFNAGYWLKKEMNEIRREQANSHNNNRPDCV